MSIWIWPVEPESWPTVKEKKVWAVDKKGKGSDKEGEIDEIILTGWRLVGGPVIRPAKVKVYKK